MTPIRGCKVFLIAALEEASEKNEASKITRVEKNHNEKESRKTLSQDDGIVARHHLTSEIKAKSLCK